MGGSKYLQYYRAVKAREEEPIYTVEVVEEHRDDHRDEHRDERFADTNQYQPLPPPGTPMKTKVLIACGVLAVILLGWLFMRYRTNDKAEKPKESKDAKKKTGFPMKGYNRLPEDPPVFYSPDTNAYECKHEGGRVTVYDCRKDVNCMWLYNGHNVNSGLCTHRVLGSIPDGGCKSLKTAHECNMRNDRYIWKHGKCMERPL